MNFFSTPKPMTFYSKSHICLISRIGTFLNLLALCTKQRKLLFLLLWNLQYGWCLSAAWSILQKHARSYLFSDFSLLFLLRNFLWCVNIKYIPAINCYSMLMLSSAQKNYYTIYVQPRANVFSHIIGLKCTFIHIYVFCFEQIYGGL